MHGLKMEELDENINFVKDRIKQREREGEREREGGREKE